MFRRSDLSPSSHSHRQREGRGIIRNCRPWNVIQTLSNGHTKRKFSFFPFHMNREEDPLTEIMQVLSLIQWTTFNRALYVQVTVHRDNLRKNNQQDAPSTRNFILSRNSTSSGHLLCPSSGVISCTHCK